VEPLPEHIADLIRQGRKIEAIKLIREETGVGLREAKDAVERLSAGMDPLPDPVIASKALPTAVEALARAGKKIEAIKVLREQTGLGLKEAKERVEAIPGVPPGGNPVVVAVIAVVLLALGVILAVVVSLAA